MLEKPEDRSKDERCYPCNSGPIAKSKSHRWIDEAASDRTLNK